VKALIEQNRLMMELLATKTGDPSGSSADKHQKETQCRRMSKTLR
jgi:hypothetical protein